MIKLRCTNVCAYFRFYISRMKYLFKQSTSLSLSLSVSLLLYLYQSLSLSFSIDQINIQNLSSSNQKILRKLFTFYLVQAICRIFKLNLISLFFFLLSLSLSFFSFFFSKRFFLLMMRKVRRVMQICLKLIQLHYFLFIPKLFLFFPYL